MIYTPTYNQCDSDGDRFVKETGNVALCMMGSRRYQAYRLASMAAWTRQPIEQRQIRFFADQHHEVAGYVTWAHLTGEVARKFLTEKNYILHPSEWNEGDLVWKMDICANQLDFRAIAVDILKLFEGNTDYFHWDRASEPAQILRGMRLLPRGSTILQTKLSSRWYLDWHEQTLVVFSATAFRVQ